MLVTEMKRNREYNFDEETLILIPNNCSTCGEELSINETLTHLSCSNLRCPDKVTLRTVSMLDQLNVTDIGEPTLRKLVKVFGIQSPLVFFLYETEDWESIDENDQSPTLFKKAELLKSQLDSKRNMTLVEFLKLANLPNIQTSSDKLLEGVSDLKQLYDELEYEGVDYVQRKLGIQAELSLKSIKMYNTLMDFKEDLLDVVDSGFVNIIADNRADVKVKAVCTDEVGGGFKRKADFYKYIDENYSNKVYIDWGKSATKSMDVLIWAGADGSPARYTNKVEKVETWNSRDSDIPILTASEFLEIIERSVDGQSVLDTLESL